MLTGEPNIGKIKMLSIKCEEDAMMLFVDVNERVELSIEVQGKSRARSLATSLLRARITLQLNFLLQDWQRRQPQQQGSPSARRFRRSSQEHVQPLSKRLLCFIRWFVKGDWPQ